MPIANCNGVDVLVSIIRINTLPIEEFMKQFMSTINEIPVNNDKGNELRNHFIAEYTFPRNTLNPLHELEEFFEIKGRAVILQCKRNWQ